MTDRDIDGQMKAPRDEKTRPPGDLGDDGLIREELSAIAEASGEARPHINELLHRLDQGGDKGDERPYLVGLALSGGGIRSATFSLGVMQRLAKAHLLRHVDYLSTVSGGGYIGSALSWWLSGRSGDKQPDFGVDEFNFPFGTKDTKEPPDGEPALDYLRAHGKYLTPGNGITIWSGAAVALRVVLLNLLVWLPTAALAFWLLWALGTAPIFNGLPYFMATFVPGALSGIVEAVGATGVESSTSILSPVFLLALICAALLLILFVLSAINYSLLSWLGRQESQANAAVEKPRKAGFLSWIAAGVISASGLVLLYKVSLGLWVVSQDLFSGKELLPLKGGMISSYYWLVIATSIAILAIAFYVEGWKDGKWRNAIRAAVEFRWIFTGFVLLFLLDGYFAWLSEPTNWPDRFHWPTWAEWPNWMVSPARLSIILSCLAGLGFLALASFWMGYMVRWLLRSDGISLFYGARRLFESFFGRAIKIACFFIVIASVPLVYTYLEGLGGLEGIASLAIGVMAAISGQLKLLNGSNGSRPPILYVIASVAFAYGILLIGYRWSVLLVEGDIVFRALIAASIVSALIVGWFVNINYIGFHRFYRDRLMEAFMPDWSTVDPENELKNKVDDGAVRAEDLRLSAIWPKTSGTDVDDLSRPGVDDLPHQGPRPFHIINTNVVLTNADDPKFRMRGGDNFILTPTSCGSNATGWVPTRDFIDNGMTLATAMAVSGAAANPRSGAGGKGITRNSFVSIAMGLLGLRLGYWVGHPETYADGRPVGRYKKRKNINHFYPAGFYALFGQGYREDNNYLELSDGGHFENLGLYELARRRCGLIVVCDGGQDVETSYSDFVNAIQRLGQDLKATISFDMSVFDRDGYKGWERSDPAQLIARETKDQYPKTAEYSDKGYFLATIDYGSRGIGAWPEKGTIIYLKSSMIRELEITAKGYKGAHPDFPNETTADQFFDEEQFEAYREVGYRVAEQMLTDLDLEKLFKAGRPTWQDLRDNRCFARRDGDERERQAA